MENELIESRAKMSFHLDGESEIDATLLSRMISDMVGLTKIVAYEVDPDAYLKMNVTAFKNGSFQIDFSAVCQVAQSLFTAVGTAATAAGAIIAAVKGGIEIKKLLKGEKPKKTKKTKNNMLEVLSESGEKVVVPPASKVVIYNVHADQFITSLSDCVKEHNPSGGFSVSDEAGSVYCSKNDIPGMSRPTPIEETINCKRVRVRADMLIRKAIFEGRSKWGFVLDGKAIEAAIIDDEFLEWFDDNGTVNRGDHIDATVEILIDLDPAGSPLKGSEKYTVVQVHGKILHEMEQLEI